MGTHPIFESDFDCLTDSRFSRKKTRNCLLQRLWRSNSRLVQLMTKFMGGCGGKHRTKAEQGQKQAANADPSKKAVSSIVSGENARKTSKMIYSSAIVISS